MQIWWWRVESHGQQGDERMNLRGGVWWRDQVVACGRECEEGKGQSCCNNILAPSHPHWLRCRNSRGRHGSAGRRKLTKSGLALSRLDDDDMTADPERHPTCKYNKSGLSALLDASFATNSLHVSPSWKPWPCGGNSLGSCFRHLPSSSSARHR